MEASHVENRGGAKNPKKDQLLLDVRRSWEFFTFQILILDFRKLHWSYRPYHAKSVE